MNLIEAATNEVERKKQEAAAASAAKRERDRLNRRTAIREWFSNALGIDVADADVLSAEDGRAFVVVDGESLALCVDSKGESAFMYCVIDGVFVRCDTSLRRARITSLADLGHVLDPAASYRGIVSYDRERLMKTGFEVSPGKAPKTRESVWRLP